MKKAAIAIIVLGWIIGIVLSQIVDGPRGAYESQITRSNIIEQL